MSATKERTSSAGSWKRILLGRALASHKAEHQLLPKVLALPVFSSDPLSSNAYATQEMMLVLVTAGASALALEIPIALAIAGLLLIVVTSYRQTVRAYPKGGGSYIVARENLGTIPGLVAAAAILTDYVLTVAVSITAGTIALASVAPDTLVPLAVPIAIVLVSLVTLANLRGVREAGTLFAVPTYGFVAMVALTLFVGFLRCIGGCPQAATANLPLETEHALTLFLILRAFSSGATALTGVEAIADGVQAFRRPQAKNAAATLAIMGGMSTTMFLGITLMAVLLGVRVTEANADTEPVLSQIGETIFGDGFLFVVLQVFTAGILILAANTAFQDFPRLSSILARDRFLPSQFRNRGDRLVYSNGVIVLAGLAALLIWVFDANLTHLIQLYVVGVFTAFTLSQTGMVRRWLRTHEPGWKRAAVINGVGAVTTGVVLVIVTLTKFSKGAWIVIVAMPIIVLFFLTVHRHYAWVRVQLQRGTVTPGATGNNHVVLLVREADAAVAEALGYLRSFRPASIRAVTPGGSVQPAFGGWWRSFAGETSIGLEPLGDGSLTTRMKEYVRALPVAEGDFVTICVPETVRGSLLRYLIGRRDLVRLKASMLREPHIVVTDVPVVEIDGAPRGVDAKPLIPQRTVSLVFVAGMNDASMRALNYARSLEASVTRAIYFDVDHDEASRIEERWFESGVGIPLDIVEAPFRDLSTPMLEEVRRFSSREDTVVNVVIPEVIVSHWWQLPLHNQNALFIKRLFLYEDRVILTDVPFFLGERVVPITAGS